MDGLPNDFTGMAVDKVDVLAVKEQTHLTALGSGENCLKENLHFLKVRNCQLEVIIEQIRSTH